jgi:hypothetical protein
MTTDPHTPVDTDERRISVAAVASQSTRSRGWGVESATHRPSAAIHCPESSQELPERGNFRIFIADPANALTMFPVSETVGAS